MVHLQIVDIGLIFFLIVVELDIPHIVSVSQLMVNGRVVNEHDYLVTTFLADNFL